MKSDNRPGYEWDERARNGHDDKQNCAEQTEVCAVGDVTKVKKTG